jgi:AcrR family transcriptional regulator
MQRRLASRPVGRPKNLEMRQRIIDGASEAFAERGFFGASMRDVGARIGITEGRVYRYFSNKRDLLDAIAANTVAQFTELLEALQRLEQDEPDIRRFMQSYAMLSEELIRRNHAWYVIWLQRPPLSEARMNELNRLSEEICGVLADTIAARTDVRDARMVANTFSGVIFTQTLFRTRIGHSGISEELVTRLVDSTFSPPLMLE